jgi:poly(3-hydroxybutyrate) depolymerase
MTVGTTPTTPAASGAAPSADPVPSEGCGSAIMPPSGAQSMEVDGTTREFIVKLPANYDANRPYRLIFGWHGLGGSAMQVAGGFGGGFYGQATRSENSAVLIAGQGLPTMNANGEMGGAGWPNTGGRDVAFARKLVEFAQGHYCIDKSRIFSVGMSYGGIMSNTVGCQLGDVFRAIAPIAGAGPRTFGNTMCVGQVAAWIAHGNMDTVVSFDSGKASRDYWVMSNHCQSATTPVGPERCVAYEGCDAGHPVHWCEFDGEHTVPPFAADAIWSFFSQF